jgi:hypothetical protein
MSTAGSFPTIYNDKIIPCPSWTGTGGITARYESLGNAVPVIRGGNRTKKYRGKKGEKGGKDRKSGKRGTKRMRGGFIPDFHPVKKNKKVKRATNKRNQKVKSVPNLFLTPSYSQAPVKINRV